MRTAISASNEEFDDLISCPATSVLILHEAHFHSLFCSYEASAEAMTALSETSRIAVQAHDSAPA